MFLTLSGTPLDPETTYLETVVVVLDGVFRKVTAAEYLEIEQEMALSEQILRDQFLANNNFCTLSQFTLGASIKDVKFHVDTPNIMSLFDRTQTTPVTAWVDGGRAGADINRGESIGFEWSVSGNLSADLMNIVKAELSGTFSANSATTWGSTHHIGPGDRARVVFTPRMKYTPGNLISTDVNGTIVSTKYVTAKQPN